MLLFKFFSEWKKFSFFLVSNVIVYSSLNNNSMIMYNFLYSSFYGVAIFEVPGSISGRVNIVH